MGNPSAIRLALAKPIRLAILFLLFAIPLAIFFNRERPQYQARSTILMTIETDAASPLLAQPSPTSPLRGVLQSQSVARYVAKALNIPIETVQDSLKVDENPAMMQVIVTATTPNRDTSYQIVRKSINALDEVNNTVGLSVAARKVRMINEALNKTMAQLKESEEALAAFTRDMKAPSALDDPTATRYINQLRDLELQRGVAEQKLQSMVQLAESAQANAANLPSAIPGVSEWRQRVVEAEYQLDVARITYGDKNPAVQRAQETVRTTRARANRELELYLQSISNNLNPDIAGVKAEIKSITWQIDQAREMATAASSEQVRLADLRRRVLSLTTASTTQQAALLAAQAEADVQRVKYSVLDEPETLPEPINKSPLRLYVLPILIGALLSLGINYGLNQRTQPNVQHA